ncbi:hypothetical protein HYW54_00770 [Candidatus Gottesmanbacteria bacterium]|nr:hypothetical protein [Candidatus Gottesmanbacteria bacterium]
MPRKTKKKKMLAEKHRLSQREDFTFQYTPVKSRSSPADITYSEAPKQELAGQYDYVGRDLFKIVIFALLAFSFQVVLVFLLRTK